MLQEMVISIGRGTFYRYSRVFKFSKDTVINHRRLFFIVYAVVAILEQATVLTYKATMQRVINYGTWVCEASSACRTEKTEKNKLLEQNLEVITCLKDGYQ